MLSRFIPKPPVPAVPKACSRPSKNDMPPKSSIIVSITVIPI